MSSSSFPPIETVVMSGLVVMKIFKHCVDSLPTSVSGPLLGLDMKGRLEVTHCFPLPERVVGEEDDDIRSNEYQLDMMKCLRSINVDSNTVGWYQSAAMGCFISDTTLETQYAYQQDIPHSVMLVFDPVRAQAGVLWMKAVRLTNKFMKLYEKNAFGQQQILKEGFTFRDIFVEVPIKIQNSHLTNAFLSQLAPDFLTTSQFDRMSLSVEPFLAKNIQLMSDSMDDFHSEQYRVQTYQRTLQKQKQSINAMVQKRAQENEDRRIRGLPELPDIDIAKATKDIQEPSRLEALCIAHQLVTYSEQVTEFAGHGLSKFYILDALQKAIAPPAVEQQ